ncbi:MAG: tRNA 2-thiocytidine biosynthesis TtcA family protein [Proteobacteria bacterium]|nr:tRNA 2-thiocytidine biosynthesis TtcA family protein [Pseudomonadota bacterium]MBU1739191.1 tRNA 2-thiocytidine biosynthesis TtcA family protein [Pseudomonadota bacterium]
MKLNPQTNQRVGRAMHAYEMLADNDRVLIAVSGGVDSLVLTWLLDHWRKKAPIGYELLAVHLDMGFGDNEAELVRRQIERLGVDHHIEKTDFGANALKAEEGRSACFHCARQRRSRLFDIAEERGFGKIAFGHHLEDIIETFFINLMYGGNLSTMVPNQAIFEGRLNMIRPMAFLEKKEIIEIGRELGVEPVANPCPMSKESKRVQIRKLLETSIYPLDDSVKANIFAALGNVRTDYLLKKL